MDDFSALAARIAVSVGQLRGCIILTRDGLVVGSFPPSDESPVQRAWLRFAALGDPEKGFVEFGDEIWVYVRRGPYAAFALADAGARPGLVMDQLQQLLLTAEEARVKRDSVRLPDVADAPKSKPRTQLHRGAAQPVQSPSLTPAEGQAAGAASRAPRPSESASPQSSERHARPLSWILAPEEESPAPPARPERRPVSWILAPHEDEHAALTPEAPRSENRTWILPPPKQVTPELSALPSLVPVSSPAPEPPPAPAPEPVSLPAPELELLPQPEPETESELLPQPEPDSEIEQEGGEVDRFTLAQEFSRLLEDPESTDESS